MIGWVRVRRVVTVGCCAMLTATGCAFQGLNSLPLPGAVGRGLGAVIYHVEIANVGTLESNSPVMIDDVVVGSIGKITVRNWRADIEVSVQRETVIPANAVAIVGQTSLLGSMHLSLDPPVGQMPHGRLQPGATLPLSSSSTYPSTEQTLSALSVVVNAGGLGQIGEIIHSFSTALSGHEDEARDLLKRLDRFIGVFDQQRDNIIASIQALNRLAAKLSSQRDVIDRALRDIPPALDVLVRERPQITSALEKFGALSDTATGLVHDTQDDLVTNLTNLAPTLQRLADVGPDIDVALAFATVFPFGQNVIDRAIRGDYTNLFAVLDITTNRLKRTLLSGTRWGSANVPVVPAPGDPGYDGFDFLNPFGQPLAPKAPPPPTPETAPPPAGPATPPPGADGGPPNGVPPGPAAPPGGGS